MKIQLFTMLFALLILNACTVFDKPQPDNKKNLASFPPTLQGVFDMNDDDNHFTVRITADAMYLPKSQKLDIPHDSINGEQFEGLLRYPLSDNLILRKMKKSYVLNIRTGRYWMPFELRHTPEGEWDVFYPDLDKDDLSSTELRKLADVDTLSDKNTTIIILRKGKYKAFAKKEWMKVGYHLTPKSN